jgi:hypothetical protein
MFTLTPSQKFFNEVIQELESMEAIGLSYGAEFSPAARQATFDAAGSMTVSDCASMVAEIQHSARAA